MNTAAKVKIFGFAGSLRQGSYNKALIRAAQEVSPEDARLEVFDLEGIPLFNQDYEYEPPETVRGFKTGIRSADAILIATPEYNYSIPGVLKNAIDWASRPFGDNAFDDKPVAAMSASVGMLGGVRAQYHLRQTFVYLNMHPVNQPEVMMPFAGERVDDYGRITDGKTKELIRQLLERLVDWTLRLRARSDRGSD